jgi:hypothetical protein
VAEDHNECTADGTPCVNQPGGRPQADRGSQLRQRGELDRKSGLTLVLRSGRGSQLPRPDSGRSFPDHWRSPSGTTEDRNIYNTYKLGYFGLERPHSGAAEDRNTTIMAANHNSYKGGGRPPGRAEDRNAETRPFNEL